MRALSEMTGLSYFERIKKIVVKKDLLYLQNVRLFVFPLILIWLCSCGDLSL
jgi:hypothetical protein